MSTPDASAPDALPWRSGLTYGLLGFPLAFAALPLYVVLPNHYARSFGLSLATVGALLMAVPTGGCRGRTLAGRASDALFARTARAVWLVGGAAALFQMAGHDGFVFSGSDGGSRIGGVAGQWLAADLYGAQSVGNYSPSLGGTPGRR